MASGRICTWWYAARRDVDRAAVRSTPTPEPEVRVYIPVTALAAPAVTAVTSEFQFAVTAWPGRAFVSENDGASTLMFEQASRLRVKLSVARDDQRPSGRGYGGGKR